MWIVSYGMHSKRGGKYWEFNVYETREEADIFYQLLLKNDNLYSASLSAVIESTDYESVNFNNLIKGEQTK